jgi:cysteine desulfurase
LTPIYLDHNATSVMNQSANSALVFSNSAEGRNECPPGNASSIHSFGRAAKSAIDEARDSVAEALGAEDPDSLLFTGSATESINTALKGFYFQHAPQGRVRFISSVVEHEATLESLHFLQSLGAVVELLPVNGEGELSLTDLEAALGRASPGDAVMVTLLAANNETGVLFPWEEAASLAARKGATFHLDGVQAFGKQSGFTLAGKNIPLASFSAHKIGGPKGVGVLVVKRGVKLVSLLHGGAQERKRRAGTVNVAGIAAFGAAARALAQRDLAAIDRRRASLEARVIERIGGVHVQGARAHRIVNTSNFLFDGVRGESLVMGLDLEGFAVSSGSACNSGSILPSHVLLAMGFDKLSAQSAARVSIGPGTTEEELSLFGETLERVVARIRGNSGRSR